MPGILWLQPLALTDFSSHTFPRCKIAVEERVGQNWFWQFLPHTSEFLSDLPRDKVTSLQESENTLSYFSLLEIQQPIAFLLVWAE